jgi:hypothetical protein
MTTRQTAALLLAGCALIAVGAGLTAGPGLGLAVGGALLIAWTLVATYGSAAGRAVSPSGAGAEEVSPVDRGVARRRIVPSHARDMPDADSEELAV